MVRKRTKYEFNLWIRWLCSKFIWESWFMKWFWTQFYMFVSLIGYLKTMHMFLLVIDNIFSVIKKSTSFNSIFEVNLRVVFMVNRYGSLKYPTLKWFWSCLSAKLIFKLIFGNKILLKVRCDNPWFKIQRHNG